VRDAGASGGFSAYREVLRVKGAAAFCVTGGLARLPQAMVGLGSVLLLTGLHRSFTLAGLVAGAVALAQGVASPIVSRVVDQRGQRLILLPLLLVHVTVLGLLVLAAQQRAPATLLIGLGVSAGLSMPQFGACARARWTVVLGDDPRMHTALSIESLIDEAVFIIGPVTVAALATTVAPSAGVLAAQVIVLGFGLAFLSQRGSEPPPHPAPPGDATAHAIRHRGLVVIVGVFLAIGVLFGLIEVGIAALAREHGHPGAAGPMLGLWATGSLGSGVAYGAIRWRTSSARRLRHGAWAMAAGSMLIAAASAGLGAATAALVIAGLANAPTLITGNTLVRSVVPARALTEAYTWLGVSVFAGIAIGSAAGGALVDQFGAGTALWASVAAGAAAGAVATIGRQALHPPTARDELQPT
jgi:MFS family permease